MASFNVTAQSGCCGVGQTSIFHLFKWQVGSVVFSCIDAKKGRLEGVFIRSIVVNKFVQSVFLYRDNNDWLWNEDDLCSESSAQAQIAAYLQKLADEKLESLLDCEL